MIEIRNITKTYENKTALDGISISVNQSGICGIVGTNGAGKTTLLRLMAGILKQDGGEILYDGQPVWEQPEVKRQITFIPDEPFFPLGSSLLKMKKLFQSFFRDFSEDTFQKLNGIFRLNVKANIGGFSKGMKKQAALMLYLSANPRYVLMDEIFDGLDPVMRLSLRRVIVDMACQKNISFVVSTHNLREIDDLCDTLALIHNGKLLFKKEIDDLKQSFFKLQCAFLDSFDASALSDADILHCEAKGKIVKLVARGDKESILQNISRLSPATLDIFPLNLEEIFIYELEAAGYEIKSIV